MNARQLGVNRVVRAWQAGESFKAGSVRTDGRRVFSYGTCILEREADGRVIRNVTTYSTTTTRHQNAAGYAAVYALIVDDVPRGADTLGQYLLPRESVGGTAGYPEGTEFTRDPKAGAK